MGHPAIATPVNVHNLGGYSRIDFAALTARLKAEPFQSRRGFRVVVESVF